MKQTTVNSPQRFAMIVDDFRNSQDVTLPTAKPGEKRRFGSSGLRFKGRVFAMLSSDGEFVVKLPRARVDSIVESGSGRRFDPRRNGHVMKEWAVLEQGSLSQWLGLAREAADYAKGSPK